jgi:glycosyltransferase involved in cell wall biosynthesis
MSYADQGDYDLILASHNTMVDYCRTRMSGFIIQTCHGTIPKLEQPSVYADAYVAVSKEVELHLLKSGIDKPVLVINNGVDLNRFKPVTVSASVPRFILSLSHSDKLNNYLEAYFSTRKVEFEALNKYKNARWDVESAISLADLVITCGRGAMESMACGRPVIVMDDRPYMPAAADGVITPENIEQLLFFNLSGRCHRRDPYDESIIDEAIDTIDIYTSDRMRYLARKYFDVSQQTKKYLSYYERLN